MVSPSVKLVLSINFIRKNIVKYDTLVVYNNSMLEYKSDISDKYIHYIQKRCAWLRISLGLILGRTEKYNIEASHLHRMYFAVLFIISKLMKNLYK